MGFTDFVEDIGDKVGDVLLPGSGSVRGIGRKLDDKLNISDKKGTFTGLATFGFTGGAIGGFYDKASAARDKANDAARTANEARMAAQRTTNFRSFYQMIGNTQQDAAQLMAVAANGGFMDSSAVKQSISSAQAQVESAGHYFKTMDRLGYKEASAMDTMRTEEQRMQKYDYMFQTSLNTAFNVGSKLIFG